ncbi:quinolinate synthase NadA [Halalkalibacter alkaliphilus]|uniref:Quinolinate synthase n=1 Tax=Halalkalibacter alkaliphilus TaxID=2917993 RepID=A0A9X1ZYY4_9BACI|nr:quinolinate synthase NadA [Halalkalibacter alkaliphilus]MCL7746961.1 quinolinate synthase NadA [Halalkalibacter alkaliphilus]
MNFLEKVATLDRIPERYKEMSIEDKKERIKQIKQQLGSKLFIPGHHYQRDEVIEFADVTGDSLQLAQLSKTNRDAEYIVFCGVHFMAETADMLTTDNQHVILPDLKAGCSMADMADIAQTEHAWGELQKQFGDTILPLTYVNSTAAIKAFCGRNGGATVTSSNAKAMVQWAFTQKQRLLFLPDQHLGRNTAYDLGIKLDEMAVWDPIARELVCEGPIEQVKVILWKGHCSVHEKFTVGQIEELRQNSPNTNIIVHPECTFDVVQAADLNGSTHYIIETIKNAEPGSSWAVGTEMNLVNRLAQQHPDKNVFSLNSTMCPCLTMNRIDLDHLLWSLEEIIEGRLHFPITVDEQTTLEGNLALQRMLDRPS